MRKQKIRTDIFTPNITGQRLARIPNLTATVPKDNLSINWDSAFSIPRPIKLAEKNDKCG